VDDECSVCRALERLLRSAGFDVATFSDGAAFLEYAEASPPACVILDLHMPHTSGFEVMTRLRERSSGIAVVTITGHDTAETDRRVMKAGAVAYLRKPVDEQTLIDAVIVAIEKGKS
jgi:FixJ family two-component response regulator